MVFADPDDGFMRRDSLTRTNWNAPIPMRKIEVERRSLPHQKMLDVFAGCDFQRISTGGDGGEFKNS